MKKFSILARIVSCGHSLCLKPLTGIGTAGAGLISREVVVVRPPLPDHVQRLQTDRRSGHDDEHDDTGARA